jgi:hypothetical protein
MKSNTKFKIGIFFVFIFCIYFLIWLIFVIDGPFNTGQALAKSDWLLFLGGYLSFTGTLLVTYMLIIQNNRFHHINNNQLRYSQLPYITIIRSDNKIEEFKKVNGGLLFDFPSLVNQQGKFNLIGIETGQAALCPEAQLKEEAIYKIQNIGLGPAMKVSLHSDNTVYDFRNHLKVNDFFMFRVDLASLEKKNQDIEVTVNFFDIYNNKYQQRLSCNFIIDGSRFTFNIGIKQFEPELIDGVLN